MTSTQLGGTASSSESRLPLSSQVLLVKGLWPAHSCHSRPQLLSQLPLRNEVLNLLELES